MKLPCRAPVVVAFIALTAGGAVADRATPLPGSIGLEVRLVATPNACVPQAHLVRRVRPGDAPGFAQAMLSPRLVGLRFDPDGDPQADLRAMDRWLVATQRRFESAIERERRLVADARRPAAARVAAAARVIQLRDQFEDRIATIEVPAAIRSIPDGRQAYCESLGAHGTSLRAASAEDRAACVELAHQLGVADGWWTAVCAPTP